MKLNYRTILIGFLLLFFGCSHHSNDHLLESEMVAKKQLSVIGWREWLSLPDLGIDKIKAKVDTGARTSSLHAFNLKFYKKGSKNYVSFEVHPDQKNSKKTIICHSEILEHRKVKSSNGQTELRPVIVTNLSLMGEVWPIEVTLTNRDEMGFRMLLGRASFKGKFLVDAEKSFYNKTIK